MTKGRKRISILLPEELMSQIEKLAEKLKTPMNKVIICKLQEAVDLSEDDYWHKRAMKNIEASQDKPLIPLEPAWEETKPKSYTVSGKETFKRSTRETIEISYTLSINDFQPVS